MKVLVFKVKDYPMIKDYIEIDGTLYHTNELNRKPFGIGKGLVECSKESFEYMLANLEYLGEAEFENEFDYYIKRNKIAEVGKLI